MEPDVNMAELPAGDVLYKALQSYGRTIRSTSHLEISWHVPFNLPQSVILRLGLPKYLCLFKVSCGKVLKSGSIGPFRRTCTLRQVVCRIGGGEQDIYKQTIVDVLYTTASTWQRL